MVFVYFMVDESLLCTRFTGHFEKIVVQRTLIEITSGTEFVLVLFAIAIVAFWYSDLCE